MIDRYTLPEMGAIWTEENKFRSWLKVEVAASRALSNLGIIPKKAFRNIEKKADFRVKRIDKIEAKVDHDVIAFLTSVAEFVGEDAKYIHYGMTSSDVLDTAMGLRMKEASELIDKKIVKTLSEIRKLARRHKMTPCIGRTHGVFAEPTSLGLKFAIWYTELKRARTRFKAATEEISVGKISGAVGNFANLDPIVETKVCRELKLKPAEVSTQIIQRDRYAAYLSSIALMASSLEKFATEIRNLQRSEIGELQEGFAKGQKGSSAMPHKKNPITAERVAGLSRILRGNALAGMENVALWHERDITHSSVERIIIPDSCILIDYVLHKFIGVLSNLIVNKKKMYDNIYMTGGLVFSQRLLLKLAGPVGSREIAYRIVQDNAMKSLNSDMTFIEIIKTDERVTKHLSEKEIDECFALDYYLRNVSKVFKRVF
ncbi:MAG: adenylosuccinate lyase [candidate division Zixibacteria bacterium]|nr:adenylosuccinate lyase [candidate division Zixibacteria bacterium]